MPGTSPCVAIPAERDRVPDSVVGRAPGAVRLRGWVVERPEVLDRQHRDDDADQQQRDRDSPAQDVAHARKLAGRRWPGLQSRDAVHRSQGRRRARPGQHAGQLHGRRRGRGGRDRVRCPSPARRLRPRRGLAWRPRRPRPGQRPALGGPRLGRRRPPRAAHAGRGARRARRPAARPGPLRPRPQGGRARGRDHRRAARARPARAGDGLDDGDVEPRVVARLGAARSNAAGRCRR